MPIRQTLYFQTEGEDGGDPKNHSSLFARLLQRHDCDSFWKALEEGTPFQGYRTPWLDPNENPVPEAEHIVKGSPDHSW